MIRLAAFAITALSCYTSACAVDAIVVRPAAWSPALQPWLAYRQSQGLELVELDSELGRQDLQLKIKEIYDRHPKSLRFLLLASDVNLSAAVGIPTFYRQSTALVQFGGDATIATDNPYADIDGDEIPELAVARIPADSPRELASHLSRVMAYEKSRDFSQWRRQVHVIAGVGGFGLLADSVMEMTTRRFLAERIPGWSDLSMTQASTNSFYCPDPWRFSEACLDRMNEGGMLWVYIGHGHVKTLDYVRAGEELLPILNDQHLPGVATQHPPIAIFLACYTGAFDALEDSLAEQLVMLDRGPIAAIAATRVSGPYGLSMLSDGMLDDFYQHQKSTLGEILLSAKRRLLSHVDDKLDFSARVGSARVDTAQANSAQALTASTPAENASSKQIQWITAIASALCPENYDLRAERLEHVWQMHLLGDPMMRIAHPTPLELEVASKVRPGDLLTVRGQTEHAGQLTMEFAYRRGQVRRELAALAADPGTTDGRQSLQERYLAANNQVLTIAHAECQPGDFECSLRLPPELPRGKYCVRLFIEGEQKCQAGYREIRVLPTETAK